MQKLTGNIEQVEGEGTQENEPVADKGSDLRLAPGEHSDEGMRETLKPMHTTAVIGYCLDFFV